MGRVVLHNGLLFLGARQGDLANATDLREKDGRAENDDGGRDGEEPP